MTTVLGVDGDKLGWVGIVLRGGRFHRAVLAVSLDQLVADVPTLDIVAIDMPIGWCTGVREVDALLRGELPGKGSSVFNAPPAAVRADPPLTYADANAASRAATGSGISRQSWALVPKIEEATQFRERSTSEVVEAHPEWSFAKMHVDGTPVSTSKRTWAGHRERARRLAAVGIEVPDGLEAAGAAGTEDVLDAAAVAWTAHRVARGTAASLSHPADIDAIGGHRVAVWA